MCVRLVKNQYTCIEMMDDGLMGRRQIFKMVHNVVSWKPRSVDDGGNKPHTKIAR
jgi:hypothetical protein